LGNILAAVMPVRRKRLIGNQNGDQSEAQIEVNDPPLKAVAFYTAPRRCDLTL